MSSGRPARVEVRFAETEAVVRAAVEFIASTDPQPDDPFRGLYVSDELALSLTRGDAGPELDRRLNDAVERLGLDDLDARMLALCLAAELDARYGRLLAYLHDDVTRRFASPRLVARLLAAKAADEQEVLSRLAHDRPLRRTGALTLLEPDGQVPLAERALKVSDRLTAYVLGARLDDVHSAHTGRRVPVPAVDPGRSPVVTELRGLWSAESRLAIAVLGTDAVELAAVAIGAPLLVVEVGAVVDLAVMAGLDLTAALEGRTLCFDGAESLPAAERVAVAAALAARHERVLLCAGSRQALVALDGLDAIPIDVAEPSYEERRVLWETHAGSADVDEVAAKFRLGAGQIARAAELARLAAAARSAAAPSRAELERGAREASSRRLEGLATRVQPSHTFDDLVLPDRQLGWLKSISSYLRHRDRVMSVWGYQSIAGPGQGLTALFFGESGTGKTMAGRVLANELGLEMYRIDLAGVVSKYIGETETNLDRIFDAAEGSNAILFFDEADALFGKRSEVGDAHDRYANIEVAFLLQRIEGYPGAVILATNFRNNLDDAFLRRLDFAVEFPFPDAAHRRAIWRRVLPREAPVAEDLDVELLAEKFKLSGGSIRNCSIAAAFLAADEGGRIEMHHVQQAVSLEYAKLGRLTVEGEFERPVVAVRP